jgi:hypothetical protein
MRRLLTDVVAELKAAAQSAAAAEARTSSTPISRNGGALYQQHPPYSQAGPYGNSYDDSGFYHYSNGGGANASIYKPAGGWLGGTGTSAVQSGSMMQAGSVEQVPPEASWGRRNPGSVSEAAPSVHVGNGHTDPYPPQQPAPQSGLMSRSSSAAGPTVQPEQHKEPHRLQAVVPVGEPTYPQSFHDVMDMVAKGITPPNVRVCPFSCCLAHDQYVLSPATLLMTSMFFLLLPCS